MFSIYQEPRFSEWFYIIITLNIYCVLFIIIIYNFHQLSSKVEK